MPTLLTLVTVLAMASCDEPAAPEAPRLRVEELPPAPAKLGFENADYVRRARVGDPQCVDSKIGREGGKALACDGDGDRLEFRQSEVWSIGTSPFTLSIWVRPERVVDAGLVSAGGFGGKHGWAVTMQADGAVRFEANTSRGASAGVAVTPPLTLREQHWTHLAVVLSRDNDLLRIFVDGHEKASTLVTKIDLTDPHARVVVGAIDESREFDFTGRFDEIQFRKAPLGDRQIENLRQWIADARERLGE